MLPFQQLLSKFGHLSTAAALRKAVYRVPGLTCAYNYSSCYAPAEDKFQLAQKRIVHVGGYGGIGFAINKILMVKNIKGLIILDFEDNERERRILQEFNPNVCFDFEKIDLISDQAPIHQSIRNAYEKLGGIDILINGSGLIKERNPQLIVDVCLMSVIYSALEVIPLMSVAEGGRGGLIVNISSVLGLEPGHFMAVHSAAKHGIIGFTRSLAHPHYYEHTGVAHMVLCPGPTETQSGHSLVRANTFDYSRPIINELRRTESQPVDQCAKRMIEAIEQGKNGDCWIIDLGLKYKVKYHTYWQYKFKPKATSCYF